MSQLFYFFSTVALLITSIHAELLDEPFGIDISGDGGVEKRILKATNYDCDKTPPHTSYVTVNFKLAKTEDLIIIETATEFEFQIGIGNVICCWDLALVTMAKGEVSLIRCSPDYAYGDASQIKSGLAPGTSLDFMVEMIKWTNPMKPKPTNNTSGRITCADIYNEYASDDSSSISSSSSSNSKIQREYKSIGYHKRYKHFPDSSFSDSSTDSHSDSESDSGSGSNDNVRENESESDSDSDSSSSSSSINTFKDEIKIWSAKSEKLVNVRNIDPATKTSRSKSSINTITFESVRQSFDYNVSAFYLLLIILAMNLLFGTCFCCKKRIIPVYRYYLNNHTTSYYTASSVLEVDINIGGNQTHSDATIHPNKEITIDEYASDLCD